MLIKEEANSDAAANSQTTTPETMAYSCVCSCWIFIQFCVFYFYLYSCWIAALFYIPLRIMIIILTPAALMKQGNT
jgi:hypothetical protein